MLNPYDVVDETTGSFLDEIIETATELVLLLLALASLPVRAALSLAGA